LIFSGSVFSGSGLSLIPRLDGRNGYVKLRA
jgi:hypothetical protein